MAIAMALSKSSIPFDATSRGSRIKMRVMVVMFNVVVGSYVEDVSTLPAIIFCHFSSPF